MKPNTHRDMLFSIAIAVHHHWPVHSGGHDRRDLTGDSQSPSFPKSFFGKERRRGLVDLAVTHINRNGIPQRTRKSYRLEGRGIAVSCEGCFRAPQGRRFASCSTSQHPLACLDMRVPQTQPSFIF
jgi:hypothetical protein